MSGKRYFYTDPLAAAWMAKHFGMQLFCLHTQAERNEMNAPESYDFGECEIDYGGAEMWEEVIGATCRRAYIHPDSLPLLEPRAGDVVIKKDEDGNNFPDWLDSWDIEQKFASGWPIIYRDGKPFHWPECED